jgi:hypothetical protein
MKYDVKLYLKHRATAYHLRYDRAQNASRLAICSCGWHSRVLRRSLKNRLRRVPCYVMGHDWDEPYPIEAGPVGYNEETDEYYEDESLLETIAVSKQCDRCYKVVDV